MREIDCNTHAHTSTAPSPVCPYLQRCVPGPGETVTAHLLEPVGITVRFPDAVDASRSLVQLWTDAPSLASWRADAAGGAAAGPRPWYGVTATAASACDYRIALIPLETGACVRVAVRGGWAAHCAAVGGWRRTKVSPWLMRLAAETSCRLPRGGVLDAASAGRPSA